MELVELIDVFKKKGTWLLLRSAASFSVYSAVTPVLWTCEAPSKSGPPEVHLGKGVLKRCFEFQTVR